MSIPPGVPVKTAQSIGPCPSYCRADCPGTQRPAHPPGACPGVPTEWLPAAVLRSYGKYSLSETDYPRGTCSGRRMMQMGHEDQFPPPKRAPALGSIKGPLQTAVMGGTRR